MVTEPRHVTSFSLGIPTLVSRIGVFHLQIFFTYDLNSYLSTNRLVLSTTLS